MKFLKICTLFTLLVIGFHSNAQYDSIFATVSGDTLTLWETGAYRNCGALYLMEINQAENQLDWYQVDTGSVAYCMCIFDLSVTYGPLEPGNYNVNVYYTESRSGDTIFDGSVYFTIVTSKPESRSGGIISQYQSDCYLGFEEPKSDNGDFRIYPVPLSAGELLNVEAAPSGGKAILEIFTITGNLVFSKQYDGNLPIRDRFLMDVLFPVSGFYLVRLRTDDQVLVKKITVL